MKAAREKKLISQSSKKAMKNQAKLPRTAGLRTISELSSGLTKAGYDPSRIEERAAVLAKVAGAKRKRAREEGEAQMDVDDQGEEGEEADWMDVDGEEPTPSKRAKANSGAVVAKGKREPRSDRRLAGMRDSAVRASGRLLGEAVLTVLVGYSKQQKLSSYGISARGDPTCWRRLASPIAQSRSRWYVINLHLTSSREYGC